LHLQIINLSDLTEINSCEIGCLAVSGSLKRRQSCFCFQAAAKMLFFWKTK